MQLSRKHQLSIKIIIGMYNERKTTILVSFDSEGIVLTSSIQTLRSESAIFVSFASVVCWKSWCFMVVWVLRIDI